MLSPPFPPPSLAALAITWATSGIQLAITWATSGIRYVLHLAISFFPHPSLTPNLFSPLFRDSSFRSRFRSHLLHSPSCSAPAVTLYSRLTSCFCLTLHSRLTYMFSVTGPATGRPVFRFARDTRDPDGDHQLPPIVIAAPTAAPTGPPVHAPTAIPPVTTAITSSRATIRTGGAPG